MSRRVTLAIAAVLLVLVLAVVMYGGALERWLLEMHGAH